MQRRILVHLLGAGLIGERGGDGGVQRRIVVHLLGAGLIGERGTDGGVARRFLIHVGNVANVAQLPAGLVDQAGDARGEKLNSVCPRFPRGSGGQVSGMPLVDETQQFRSQRWRAPGRGVDAVGRARVPIGRQ